jgi:putative addiction module antidote
MFELTLRKLGPSVGVVLPKDARDRMLLELGDRLVLVETESGWHLVPCEPEYERRMRVANTVFETPRDALRDLAT